MPALQLLPATSKTCKVLVAGKSPPATNTLLLKAPAAAPQVTLGSDGQLLHVPAATS